MPPSFEDVISQLRECHYQDLDSLRKEVSELRRQLDKGPDSFRREVSVSSGPRKSSKSPVPEPRRHNTTDSNEPEHEPTKPNRSSRRAFNSEIQAQEFAALQKTAVTRKAMLSTPVEDNTADATTLYGKYKRIVTHSNFDVFFVGVIMLNVMMIALTAQRDCMQLEVDYLNATKIESNALEDIKDAEQGIGWFFEVMFTLEVALKIIALHCKFFCDGWNLFDFASVVVCLGAQMIGSLGFDVKIIRIARLMKLLRLIKIARTAQGMDQLYVMITAMKGSVQVFAWVVALMFLLQTTWALILNQALAMVYFEDDSIPLESRQKVFVYFGTFVRSWLSAFEMTLANWPPITRLLTEHVSQIFIIVGVMHKLFIGFAVVGVINGVFMQETFKAAANDDVIMERQKMRAFKLQSTKLRRLFRKADVDGGGSLDRNEITTVMSNPEIGHWLSSLDLRPSDSDTLFTLLDPGSGEINEDQLIAGVSRLKGSARSIDVQRLILGLEDLLNGQLKSVSL